jgi:glycosyltransferase involved in cell wall biosynthesis
VLAAQIALARDPRLVFLIAGDGPAYADLVAECEARGVTDRFRFTGWLEHAQLPELLTSCEMVVMPSESECQALVYLEAQACERVLVASDIPAAREVIEHGATGLLFPRGDIASLADSILTAAADPGLRQEIGTRAHARVQGHALPLVAAAYERVLGVVARSTPQPASAPSSA